MGPEKPPSTLLLVSGEEVWLSGPHGSKVYRGNGNFLVDGKLVKTSTICVAWFLAQFPLGLKSVFSPSYVEIVE